MGKFPISEVCKILDIPHDAYGLPDEKLTEYFNYFAFYLGVANPREYIFSKRRTLGASHGLFYLMLGKFLKNIDEKYAGTIDTKRLLFSRFSDLNHDTLAEIFVLGQLSQNGCELKYYCPIETKNPEAIIIINGIEYALDVTKVHWFNDKGNSIKSDIGNKKLDLLFNKYPDKFAQFANKTIIIEPKTSFQKFIDVIVEKDLFEKYFLSANDEVKILDGIVDRSIEYGYNCIVEGKRLRIYVASCMGAIFSKVWEKNEQYKDSASGFLLYIDISRTKYFGYGGGFVIEAQNALKEFSKCVGIVLFEQFAIDFESKDNSIFESCCLITNANSKNPLLPIFVDKNYNFGDIDKCILCQKNHYLSTKDGSGQIISKRPFKSNDLN
jgi:hypothetical protein